MCVKKPKFIIESVDDKTEEKIHINCACWNKKLITFFRKIFIINKLISLPHSMAIKDLKKNLYCVAYDAAI